MKKHYTVDPFGLGDTVGEYNADGALTSRYTHGLGLIGKDDLFYTFDGNGNTSELTDASMGIVNYYLYEPFGKSLHALEQVDNEFEFVGQLGVRRMGDDLIYMRNRFYAPSTGRFLSEDPIGLAGGDVSFYRYVQNDPINLVDPDGLHKKDKTFGLSKKFWNWYHTQRKKPGDPDLTHDDAQEFFEEWQDLGEPGPDKKKHKRRRGRKFGLYAPTPITWCLEHPESCPELFPDLFKEPCEE